MRAGGRGGGDAGIVIKKGNYVIILERGVESTIMENP